MPKKYKALKDFEHGGVEYKVGEEFTLEIDEDAVVQLIGDGALEEVASVE